MTQPLKNQIWSCSSACPSAYDQNKMRKKYKNGEEKSYLIFHPIVRWCSPSLEMTWCANIRMRRYFISSNISFCLILILFSFDKIIANIRMRRYFVSFHQDHLQNSISSKSMTKSK